MGKHTGWFASGDSGKAVGYSTKAGAKRAAKSIKGGKVEGPLTGALKALLRGGK